MNDKTMTNSQLTTADGKKITVIPATKSLHPERDGVRANRPKMRVAAYCRVSTVLEEQQGSYELQKQYYTKLISNNSDWELAGIYGDEGKSGTSLKGRTGFLNMMDDVRAGKIDYIITKATSRFGRNNMEFIQILDELESFGVEVLFESEGIVSAGPQNRVMLQVMGATNEHYSSALSKNIRWSKERNMRQGKATICYGSFLGYEKGADGNPQIVEDEAKIVRLIFQLFIEGGSYAAIAREMMGRGIPSPKGGERWLGSAVKRILTNEKYCGNVLLQKTYKRNYLDKSTHKNNGERAKVLIENNHPAIIDKDTFAKAQELVKKRAGSRSPGTSKSPFVEKVVCADCGGYFGHKTWNSRGNIKYDMWICNHKYTEETSYTDDKCQTANLREEWLEQGYLYTINQILAAREAFTAKYGQKLARITRQLESGEIEKKLRTLDQSYADLDQQLLALDQEQEFVFGKNSEYLAKLRRLEIAMEDKEQAIAKLEDKRNNLRAEKKNLETMLKTVEGMADNTAKSPSPSGLTKITRFRKSDFLSTIDRIEVSPTTLSYYLYGGECVKVKIDNVKMMCY